MGKQVSFGSTLSLEESQALTIAKCVSGDAPVADKLSAVASGLLGDLAKGGVMIPGEWARRIESAIGTTDAQEIVDRVEQASGRSGESPRIEWIPDPTWLGFLQGQADNAGITLSHQLKAHLDFALYNGWLGTSAPEPFKLLLSQEDYRELQQLLKKDNVTGFDVMEKLREVEGATFVQAAAEEDDLVFGGEK